MHHSNDIFPWKSGAKVPGKVGLSTLGKILTMDNLIKRKIIIVDWYCMCKSSGETNWSLVIALYSCKELVFHMVFLSFVFIR